MKYSKLKIAFLFLAIILLYVLLTNTLVVNAYGANVSNKKYDIESFMNGYRNATDKKEYVNQYIDDKGITDINEFARDLTSARANVVPGLHGIYSQAINDVNAYNASGVGRNDETNQNDNNGDESVSSGMGSFSDWQHQAENFISMGKDNQTITTNDAITVLLPAGRLLVGIATIVLVIVGSIMGVKYMIAGANEKAQLKEKLIYYVISVVLVYGAIGIFTLVVGLMNSILA